MSVRKHIRHSEGNYEKIGLLNETLQKFCLKSQHFLSESNSKYSSKSSHNSVHYDLSASKEKDILRNSHVNSSSKKLEYSNISPVQAKSHSKSSHSRESQRSRGSTSSPNDRHGSSSHSSCRYKSYSNADDNDFDWSQHTSKSGKTYYYNKRTEQSQWEKPKEWIEREIRIKAKERERKIRLERDSNGRDSKDSNKYSRTSPYKKEYSRQSSHSKRNHESSEVDGSKVVRTYGSNTSASTTVSNRSSGCPTPEGYVGSPLSTSLSSVQDISPPSTPSNNSITVVSPYTNSSTPRNITTSPHLFNHSPGLSLSNPNTPLVSGAYSSSSANNRSQYLQSQYRNYSSSSGTQVYQNADQNNGATTEPVSPAPVLHPLQQATLLQQQQLVGALPLMMTSPVIQQSYNRSPQETTKNYNSVRNEVEQPPPPPPQQRSLVTPPPPPPPHDTATESPKIELENSRVNAGYVNNRTDSTVPASFSHSQKRSRPDSPLVGRKRQKSVVDPEPQPEPEPEFTDLCNLQPFSSYCDRTILDSVSTAFGNVLDRQANICWSDGMLRMLGDAEQARTTSHLVRQAFGILETRVDVNDHRISSLREVTEQVERLQDSKGGS